MVAKYVLNFMMSTIDFQGFQVLTVSESKIFFGAPASDVVARCTVRGGRALAGKL